MRHHQIDRLQQRPLYAQVCWFVRLRWLVAAAVLIGSAIDWSGVHHYRRSPQMFVLGAVILAYNGLFHLLLRHWRRRAPRSGPPLMLIAWAQIVLDLACLTLLALATGGAGSPLLGFYVFHMVFASLMLPRAMAFAGAAVAIAMVGGALAWAGLWPSTFEGRLALLGWVLTLVLTVWVANVITLDLRRQRRRLIRKNLRIRAIKNELQRHQAVLVQQEKMAGLGQMAAGVAHEIANPLASMDSVLQLMQRRPEKASTTQTTTLREQVTRIHRIVRQLTAFAHPVDNEWHTINPNEVVEEAVRLAGLDGRVKRARIETFLSPDLRQIPMLSHATEQVLINLLLNALDATAEIPEPRVTIRTSRAGGRWCTIEVTDNGHGIPPELMDRIFEPFFTTKPVGKGTGLGLSISYSLMRQQGGSISVRTQVGKGTTFTLRLLLEREAIAAVDAVG
jgi:signal transduction histidine kinase